MPIVTLTTDFGLSDAFVGAMKGVLLSHCPGVQIVDITHEVPAQNVTAGALRLAAAAPHFPARTVHLAVVDPGVGSERRGIAVVAKGQSFVGPDNGVLSLAAPAGSPGWRAIELTRADVWATQVSSTFHGRDIFAPVAGHLASGQPLEMLGTGLETITAIDLPRPIASDEGILATVIDVDRFGNLITNVRQDDLAGGSITEVVIGGVRIAGASTWYDPSQSLVALFNSEGWLEVAAPLASASKRLDRGLGAVVQVHLRPAEQDL